MAWRIHAVKEPEDEAIRSLNAMLDLPDRLEGLSEFAAAVGCAATANDYVVNSSPSLYDLPSLSAAKEDNGIHQYLM